MWLGTRRTLPQKAAETVAKCILTFSCSFLFVQTKACSSQRDQLQFPRIIIDRGKFDRLFVRALRPSSFRSSFAAEFSFTFLFQRPNRSNLQGSLYFRRWCNVSLWGILSSGNMDDWTHWIRTIATF